VSRIYSHIRERKMLKSRPFLLLAFALFYLLVAAFITGIIIYGIAFTGNRDTIWLFMLFLSLALAGANIGILFYQNWARRLHMALAGLFSAIVIPAILKFVIKLYACTGQCEPVNSTPAEIAALVLAGLLLAMLIGSMIYFSSARVKNMFVSEED